MKYKLLSHEASGRSYTIVFDPSDEVLAQFQHFCESENVYTARLAGVGALARAMPAFYNLRDSSHFLATS